MKEYKKEIGEIRNNFLFLKRKHDVIYFDNAATSLKPTVVIEAIYDYYINNSVNVERVEYDIADECKKKIKKIRNNIKEFIGAEYEEEVIYTPSATSSINMIAYMLENSNILKKDDIILIGDAEHSSNLLPWYRLSKNTGVKIIFLNIKSDQIIHLSDVEKIYNKNVKLLIINSISNVIGKNNEIDKIGDFLKKNKCMYFLDVTQSIAHDKLDVNKINCTFCVFSAHKMYGPTGIGILYIKKNILDKLDPYELGGGMNENIYKEPISYTFKDNLSKFHAGTLNYAGIFGLDAAISFINKIGYKKIHLIENSLRDYLIDKMSLIKDVIIYNKVPDIPIICFNLQKIFCQDVGFFLNKKNICVRYGDNCVKLFRFNNNVNRYIRMSLCFYNTYEEIDIFIETIKKCCNSVYDVLFS